MFISIVGADRVGFGYIRSKLEAESVIADCGLPWTTLRATQFYDLILAGAHRAARLPVPVPAGFRVQPVDADDVAAKLVDLALFAPAGRVSDLGGPHVTTAAELVCAYLQTIGRRRPVIQVWIPGTRPIRAGGLLPQEPAQASGQTTWEQFLAKRTN